MDQNTTLEILKQGILLEKRGKIFYASAAENSKDPDVKNVFQIMADEENEHIKFLEEQYLHYEKKGKFSFVPGIDRGTYSVTEKVITKTISDRVSAVSYEAAAISLAIDMENRAITVYSERAKNASDPEEKMFYQWLAEWERGHHQLLFQLDQELKEKIWTDNNFWAF
jgi:rubrerythrin